jgi:hypothetical protein
VPELSDDRGFRIILVALAFLAAGLALFAVARPAPAASAPAQVAPSPTPTPDLVPNAHTAVVDPVVVVYRFPPPFPAVAVTCDRAGFRILQVQGHPEATRYVKDTDSCPPKR